MKLYPKNRTKLKNVLRVYNLSFLIFILSLLSFEVSKEQILEVFSNIHAQINYLTR